MPNLQARIGMPKSMSMSFLLAVPSKWMASPLCVTANLQFSKPVEQARSIAKINQTLHDTSCGVSCSLLHCLPHFRSGILHGCARMLRECRVSLVLSSFADVQDDTGNSRFVHPYMLLSP